MKTNVEKERKVGIKKLIKLTCRNLQRENKKNKTRKKCLRYRKN